MSIKFSSFSIRGIDVSTYNGLIDWDKLATIGFHFSGIRAGYGVVADTQFAANWKNAKGKVNRIAYWYMDYYSNHHKGWSMDGIPDAEWGTRQADACWQLVKDDPEGLVFLDIENGSSNYAPAINTVTSRAQAIAKAFMQRIDQLNGKTNGVYCSIGLLNWFAEWFKDRPLWVAWYNESQSAESVKKAVKASGWTGTAIIWQYASHGALFGDGIPQGKNYGTQLKELDLNAGICTAEQYAIMIGRPVITSEDETPVVEEGPEEPVTTEYIKCRVNTARLNIRAMPTTTSKVLGSLLSGTPLNICKGITPGTGSVQGWVQIYGQEGYVSLDWLEKV